MVTRRLVLTLLAAFPAPIGAAEKDAFGDPLPEGARARLGTTRMRNHGGWSDAALTPDGKHILLHDGAGGLKRIEVATGLAVGPGGKYPVKFKYTPWLPSADRTRAVVIAAPSTGGPAGQTGEAVVWDVTTGKVLLRQPCPIDGHAVALSADGKRLAIGGGLDFRTREPVATTVWDVDRDARRVEVKPTLDRAASVALSADGKTLATWGHGVRPGRPGTAPAGPEVVQFWDAQTGNALANADTGRDAPGAVVLTADGRAAAVAAVGGEVLLIDTRTGAIRHRLPGPQYGPVSPSFSPDGKTLATSEHDGTVKLWAVETGRLAATVAPPVGRYRAGPSVTFTGDGRVVAFGASGSSAAVWEIPSGKLLSPDSGHQEGVYSVAFAAGGREVVTGGWDGAVYRWDARTGKLLKQVAIAGEKARTSRTISTVVSPDGTAVAFGLRAFDLATGAERSALLATIPVRTSLANRDGTAAVTNAGETAPALATRVQVFDVVAGAKLADLGVRPGEVYAFAVSPDRSRVVTQTGSPSADRKRLDRFVTTWDAKTGRKVAEVSPPEGATVGMLALAADNTTAAAAWGNKLNAFDLVGGKVLREFDTGGLYASTAPVFAPDGRTFAVGFGDGGSFGPATIRVYEWATGRVVRSFKGHDAAAFSLAFSADGKTLASGSLDCTVLLWDVAAK